MRRRSVRIFVGLVLVVLVALIGVRRVERGLRPRAARPVGRTADVTTAAPRATAEAASAQSASGHGSATPTAAPRASVSPTAITAEQALEEVQALVDRGKVGAARALAEHYLRVIPDGPEAARIKSLTGVHPHP